MLEQKRGYSGPGARSAGATKRIERPEARSATKRIERAGPAGYFNTVEAKRFCDPITMFIFSADTVKPEATVDHALQYRPQLGKVCVVQYQC